MPISHSRVVALTAIVIAIPLLPLGCSPNSDVRDTVDEPLERSVGGPPVPTLPGPGPVVFRFPVVEGWSAGEAPVAPPGFVVEARW